MTIETQDQLDRLMRVGGVLAAVCRMMQEGMVFTIEPFLSTGAEEAEDNGDGWTLVTEPGILTAQYEHTLVVTKRGPIVVTR